jgi:hypothetical protein
LEEKTFVKYLKKFDRKEISFYLWTTKKKTTL